MNVTQASESLEYDDKMTQHLPWISQLLFLFLVQSIVSGSKKTLSCGFHLTNTRFAFLE